MTIEKLSGVEIPRELWPSPESSGGPLPGFLSENPGRLWCLDSNPKWLFCLVIMPGPVGWACLMGPIHQPAPASLGPLCEDIWTEGFAWFRELVCPVVQFLVEVPETNLGISLHPKIPLPNTFNAVTEFWDLRWKNRIRPQSGLKIQGASWIPSFAGDCEEIAVATMSGSLDCPELTAYRSDKGAWQSLIQIHGPKKPCWILQWEKKSAGVLLGQLPEWGFPNANPTGEISYFGIVPEFRGKHLGAQILLQFLEQMVPTGGSMATMVDARNTPACKTYQKVGFQKSRVSRLFLAKS